MTEDEIYDAAAKAVRQRPTEVALAVTAALRLVRKAVADGGEVHFEGFGTFKACTQARVTSPHPIDGRDSLRNELGQYVVHPGGWEPLFVADEAFVNETRTARPWPIKPWKGGE